MLIVTPLQQDTFTLFEYAPSHSSGFPRNDMHQPFSCEPDCVDLLPLWKHARGSSSRPFKLAVEFINCKVKQGFRSIFHHYRVFPLVSNVFEFGRYKSFYLLVPPAILLFRVLIHLFLRGFYVFSVFDLWAFGKNGCFQLQ